MRVALALAAFLLTSAARAETKFADLQSCYQPNGQLEETTQGKTKVTTFKTEADVAASCNEKAAINAKGASAADVAALAKIVQFNSNQQSSLKVYVAGISAKTRKDLCDSGDAWQAMRVALESPADHPHSNNALAFLEACWPENKVDVAGLLDGEPSGYVKQHICKLLKSKNVSGKG